LTLARDAAARLRRWPGFRPGLLLAASCILLLAAVLAACVEDPTAVEPDCEQATALDPGSVMAGSLDSNDPRFEEALIDYYSVVLADTALIFLNLESTDFDPFIYLFGSGNSVTAQSYDPHGEPPGASESAILARSLAPGCHLIGATAWDATGAGAYTLRLQIAQPLVEGADTP
jgi:hypothetical protein